jgi:manganese/iron transport system permease protein
MAVAAAIGVASGVVGLAISQHWRVAAGAAIVLVAATLFTVSLLVAPRHGLLARRRVSRPGAPARVGVPTAGR